MDHCGSVDIDLVVRPTMMVRDEEIRSIVRELGYKQTGNVFRFKRSLNSLSGKKQFDTHLDFLTEPGQLIEVQRDLKACLVAGSHIVFSFRYDQKVDGTIPGNGEADAIVPAADIVGSLALKGQACSADSRTKTITMSTPSPDSIAETRSKPHLPSEVCYTSAHIPSKGQSFARPSRVGPVQVARFIGADVSTDAYERVNSFVEATESERNVRW